MWSYVQYRRIGKAVKAQRENHSSCFSHDQPDLEMRWSSTEDIVPLTSPIPINVAGRGDADVLHVEPSGEDDPLDPKNWPLLSRVKATAIIMLLVLTLAWSGATEALSNEQARAEFRISATAEDLSVAMWLFGVGSGSLFYGPLSNTVGRNPTYLGSTFAYLFFVLGSALTPTFGGQIVCRFLVGLCCSATLSINGASARDLFGPVEMGFVFPCIAWANIAGKSIFEFHLYQANSRSFLLIHCENTAPAIAPIASGWINSNPRLGWRWTEWITLIISAFAFLVAFLFLPETHLPTLVDWKARQLRQRTRDTRYKSRYAESASFLQKIKDTLPQPVKYFYHEPVIAVLGAYLILIYILLFTFQSGFDYIFKDVYAFDPGLQGSSFGAIAAGATLFAGLAPAQYLWMRRQADGDHVEPELRLWPAIFTAPLLPISLFWLGWTDMASISPWSVLGACFVFGFTLMAIYISSYEYIIDSYGEHSSIALASITMVRYVVAGGMVLASRPLFNALQVRWTMTLLGCVAGILVPAPLIFWWYGPKLRKRSKYAN